MFEKHEIEKLVKLVDAVKAKDDRLDNDFIKYCQNIKVYVNEAEKAWKSNSRVKAISYLNEMKRQLNELDRKIEEVKRT